MSKEMKNGEVYMCFVEFTEEEDKENPKGKIRPVVVFQPTGWEEIYMCKVSSQIHKPLKRKLGYELQDWKEAGLKKPSIVALDKENIKEIQPHNIKSLVGQLTDRDIKGMFMKQIQVLARERHFEMNKQNTLER